MWKLRTKQLSEIFIFFLCFDTEFERKGRQRALERWMWWIRAVQFTSLLRHTAWHSQPPLTNENVLVALVSLWRPFIMPPWYAVSLLDTTGWRGWWGLGRGRSSNSQKPANGVLSGGLDNASARQNVLTGLVRSIIWNVFLSYRNYRVGSLKLPRPHPRFQQSCGSDCLNVRRSTGTLEVVNDCNC